MIKKTTLEKRRKDEEISLRQIRNELIRFVKNRYCVSYRQLGLIFNISSMQINRVLNKLESHPERKRAKKHAD